MGQIHAGVNFAFTSGPNSRITATHAGRLTPGLSRAPKPNSRFNTKAQREDTKNTKDSHERSQPAVFWVSSFTGCPSWPCLVFPLCLCVETAVLAGSPRGEVPPAG